MQKETIRVQGPLWKTLSDKYLTPQFTKPKEEEGRFDTDASPRELCHTKIRRTYIDQSEMHKYLAMGAIDITGIWFETSSDFVCTQLKHF